MSYRSREPEGPKPHRDSPMWTAAYGFAFWLLVPIAASILWLKDTYGLMHLYRAPAALRGHTRSQALQELHEGSLASTTTVVLWVSVSHSIASGTETSELLWHVTRQDGSQFALDGLSLEERVRITQSVPNAGKPIVERQVGVGGLLVLALPAALVESLLLVLLLGRAAWAVCVVPWTAFALWTAANRVTYAKHRPSLTE